VQLEIAPLFRILSWAVRILSDPDPDPGPSFEVLFEQVQFLCGGIAHSILFKLDCVLQYLDLGTSVQSVLPEASCPPRFFLEAIRGACKAWMFLRDGCYTNMLIACTVPFFPTILFILRTQNLPS